MTTSGASSANDLPVPGTIAAGIDMTARIRAFDGGDGALVGDARALYAMIEEDLDDIVMAYWAHYRTANPGAAEWSPLDHSRLLEAGRAYLRNRFCDLAGIAWVESL